MRSWRGGDGAEGMEARVGEQRLRSRSASRSWGSEAGSEELWKRGLELYWGW